VIGVFGGTFDPPHLGHLILADEARAVLNLSKVMWVVTGDPPHKSGWPLSPLDQRVKLVETAIAQDPYFQFSPADVDRPGPHYALGTMSWLRDRHPGEAFAYLMGSDSLVELPGWHRPADFLRACERLGVLRRPGAEVDFDALETALPGVRAKTVLFDAPFVGVSAHDIRARVRSGRPYRYLVAPGVAEAIEHWGMYR
jgi:nicotinate-nucleotide adenylyltransferase